MKRRVRVFSECWCAVVGEEMQDNRQRRLRVHPESPPLMSADNLLFNAL